MRSSVRRLARESDMSAVKPREDTLRLARSHRHVIRVQHPSETGIRLLCRRAFSLDPVVTLSLFLPLRSAPNRGDSIK
jgi:hypothetical protein